MNKGSKIGDVMDFLRSPTFRRMQDRMAEIGLEFEALSGERKSECVDMLSYLIAKDIERSKAEEAGLITLSDYEQEEIREDEALAIKMQEWFPRLRGKSEEDIVEYSMVLLSYYANKNYQNKN